MSSDPSSIFPASIFPASSPPATPVCSTSSEQLVLSFDDNRLLGDLFGQFDQNVALIEQRLGIRAYVSGNQVNMSGTLDAIHLAQRVLEELYQRLKQGGQVTLQDVGVQISQLQDQGQLFTPLEADSNAKRTYGRISTRRKSVVARTRAQDIYLSLLEHNTLIFGIGPAGTGKTYLAVAYAAAMLEGGEVDRIILSRPAVEAGERLGVLPGDMRDKVDPYLRPLYDALHDMIAPEKVERGLQTGQIEVAPLAFIRGRTLSNAAIILDEAQNTTSMQMKMFLTRLGENSKMIITGDPSQVDLPANQVSGLVEAVGLLRGLDQIGLIEFKDVDVVRHEMVARIVRAYETVGRERSLARRPVVMGQAG